MRRLPARTAQLLQSELSELTLVGIDEQLEDLQMIKNATETAALEAVNTHTKHAIENGILSCPVGSTELELAGRIYLGMIMAGGAPVFQVLGSGERGLLAHPDPLPKVMQEGEIFRVDAGSRFPNGIMSDLARTGVVGESSDTQKEIDARADRHPVGRLRGGGARKACERSLDETQRLRVAWPALRLASTSATVWASGFTRARSSSRATRRRSSRG